MCRVLRRGILHCVISQRILLSASVKYINKTVTEIKDEGQLRRRVGEEGKQEGKGERERGTERVCVRESRMLSIMGSFNLFGDVKGLHEDVWWDAHNLPTPPPSPWWQLSLRLESATTIAEGSGGRAGGRGGRCQGDPPPSDQRICYGSQTMIRCLASMRK